MFGAVLPAARGCAQADRERLTPFERVPEDRGGGVGFSRISGRGRERGRERGKRADHRFYAD